MKRCFSMALILALLTATIPSPALSEAPEIVSAFVDAEVAPAQTAGDTGLTVDGGDELPAPEAAPEAAVEAPALDETAAGYARVRAAAALYGDGEGTSLVAWIDGDSVVLVTEEGPLTGIALFTQRGILAGYMDAANLERLDAEATAAYLDAAAGGVAVALYDDRLDRPLTLSGCAFADDPAAVQAEEQVAGEAEDTEAEGPEADGDETPKAAAVARLNRDAITIGVGEKYSGLSAVAASADVALPKITWSSGNKKVAKVNAKTGVVTGVAAGSCTVTAKLPGGQALSCKVTVAKAPKSVSLEKTKLTLTVGMKARLTASVPKGTASGALSFKSSKSKCVTVDENGVVTAVKKGSATITVTTFNGKTATCKVTVKKAPATLAFTAAGTSIAEGQTVRLKATAKTDSGDSTPADITYAIDPASPDAGCIELDAAKGAVKGLRRGTAIVTATTQNGLIASCTVTVDVAPAAVELNQSSVTIGVGEKFAALGALLTPPSGAATCATAVTWSSSNKSVAKVNAITGVITGVKKGTATIKATAAGGRTATCKVTVAKAPKSVSLKETKLTLTVGMKARLTASVPNGAASGALSYKSNKSKYVTVDENGVVTAVKKGSATITVTTFNGKTATCKVTVKKAPAALAFACGSISIAVDQKVSLTATAKTDSGDSTPADITYIVDAFSPDAGCIELDAAEGTVKGLRKGTAIVTATTQNGLIASCTVTVDAAPKSIALNKSSATIGVGEKYDALSAELTPPSGAATCATAVTWSSSDKDVAKVNATTGVITGVKKGTATIKATAAGGKTATCKVTVKKAPTGLTVKPEVGALKVGQTGQYKVTLSPSGSAGRITYASSDTAVATVDDSGFVTAVAPGNITITVTTYNGHSKTVSLEVSDDEESDDDDDEGGSDITSSANAKKLEYVISVAQNQLGKPYVYGSGYSKDSNPRGFDCSGLMYWCFLHIDIKLKDTAYKQGYDDSLKKITKKSSLRRGDLVFFNTNSSDGDLSDHSGLYLGNGKFIHASSSAAKVVISDMSKSGSYYDRVFSWGRRVLN